MRLFEQAVLTGNLDLANAILEGFSLNRNWNVLAQRPADSDLALAPELLRGVYKVMSENPGFEDSLSELSRSELREWPRRDPSLRPASP